MTQTAPQIEQADDLIQIQLNLEEAMTQRGYESFHRSLDNAKTRNGEEGTAHGMTILKGRLEKYTIAITEWLEETKNGAPGMRKASAYRKIKHMRPEVLAFIALRNIIAGISQVRNLQGVSVTIGTAVEDELRLSAIRSDDKKKYSSIIKGAQKRTTYHYKHIYAVRRAEYAEDGWKEWTPTERLHVGMKMIDICVASLGLIEITDEMASNAGRKSMKFIKALPETLAWIDRKNDVTSLLRPVYEPMVVQPRDWSTPFDGGYLSASIKPLRLVKSNSQAYMEELAHTDMPIVYEAINALQRTAWQVNSPVLDVMKTLWANGSALAGIPAKDGLELPTKPFDIDTNTDARKAYRTEAAAVHHANLQLMSKRISFGHTLDIAKRYNDYRRMFMPYTLDFRGRIYAVPHLNPQGNDPQKSLLRFANGKPLGAEGWKWLAVHGANVIGNDKCTYEDRVQFILDNEEEICAIAANPYDNRGWCNSIGGIAVDKPWQTLAFCFEWAGYVENGDRFVSKLPVALDGSCSGIQHFSAMLRDEHGGSAVNLTAADLPADVYGLVAKRVVEQMEIDKLTGTSDELLHNDQGVAYVKRGTKLMAEHWSAFGVTRKTTKRSVMTLAYGSGEYGFKEQLMEDILTPARLKGDAFPFDGDGYGAAAYLAKLIWRAVNKVLVKAGEAMKWLQQVAAMASKEQLPVRWTTAVGFPVMQAYADMTDRRIDTALSGKVVQLVVKEANKEGKLDSRAQRNGIAPNFVHGCDAAHMMLTVVRAKQQGIKSFAMIHDSFGALAADIGGPGGLYDVVRESFIELYDTADVLQNFRDDVAGVLSEKGRETLPMIPVKGNLELAGIMESRYCFS
jgi:DNA-directed RNA polymerase